MAVPRTLEELNQHPVFSYFLWLCEIPHATFKEKALSNAIYTWAKRHEKWMSWQDTHHNLYIRKPATPGYEAKPALLFQAHLDMVCVAAPGVIHNFDKDPLTLALEGDRLTTGGRTTLGADDGIGVALAMALLDDETQAHPESKFFSRQQKKRISAGPRQQILIGSMPTNSSISIMPGKTMPLREAPAATGSTTKGPSYRKNLVRT